MGVAATRPLSLSDINEEAELKRPSRNDAPHGLQEMTCQGFKYGLLGVSCSLVLRSKTRGIPETMDVKFLPVVANNMHYGSDDGFVCVLQVY